MAAALAHRRWRYALASIEGTSHTSRHLPCQDVSECRVLNTIVGDVLVAVVSDGAGSAQRAEAGARLACEVIQELVAKHYANRCSARDLSDENVKDWLAILATRVKMLARDENYDPHEYSCTLLGAIVEDEDAALFQVGDGAIVVATSENEGQYDPVFWPQRGEYANVTHFATSEDARFRLQFEVRPNASHSGRVVEVALLSDGLQALALQYRTQTAHGPFFAPVFTRLRAEPADGYSQPVTSALKVWLGSRRICERTDDDKSLVVATRVAPSVETSTSIGRSTVAASSESGGAVE